MGVSKVYVEPHLKSRILPYHLMYYALFQSINVMFGILGVFWLLTLFVCASPAFPRRLDVNILPACILTSALSAHANTSAPPFALRFLLFSSFLFPVP